MPQFSPDNDDLAPRLRPPAPGRGPASARGAFPSGLFAPRRPDQQLVVEIEWQARCVVARAVGQIDYCTAPLLRHRLLAATRPGPGTSASPRLVVDLRQMTFCDSSGIGVLVALLRQLRAADGDLALAHVPSAYRYRLRLLGLTDHLRSFMTLTEAIDHLTRPPGDHPAVPPDR
ncbi:STAS domain-containing protein [Spirillospora sp. NPDC127200]